MKIAFTEELKTDHSRGMLASLWFSRTFVFVSRFQILFYRTITLPVVLYECANLVSCVKERTKTDWVENRVPKRVFGLMRDEESGGCRKPLKEFTIFMLHMILLRWLNEGGEMGRACSAHGGDKCVKKVSWKAWREGTTWKMWAQMVAYEGDC
jgi:hypothetical protein